MNNRIIYRDPYITVFQSALYQLNSTVVVTNDTILVIDPAYLPEEVEEIALFAERQRKGKQLLLVFTHSDFDHIVGYGAFKPDKVFASEAFVQRTDKEAVLQEAILQDQRLYIQRPYELKYPDPVDFPVFRDGAQYRNGQTKMTFYITPGHTVDSMMIIVWQLGLCIAGDYLSDIEFPFIGNSSVDYERTLEKMLFIHDRNWFTRLIPGHGTLALTINDWLKRRTDGLNYLHDLRESIALDLPFDEEALWKQHAFPHMQRPYHVQNVAIMRREFEQGLWRWDPDHVARQRAAAEKVAVPSEANDNEE